MAKNEDYWKERFEQLEDAQDKKGAEYFAELEKQYNKAALSVQADIERWYTRFAINNSVSLQDARKLLTSNELEEFRWNVMEYIEKGKSLNISNQWAKQLENASIRFHISRLDAIKLQIQNQVEVLYGNELDEVTKLMTDIYTDGYYHTAYEIQKGFNIGYDLMKLDENKVAKVLSKPWAADGSNFSDRIWKHKSQLLSELHNGLTQAIIRGQNPSVVTDAIAKRFNVSKGRAGALVMTESAFFASASNHDCYKDLGVERYEILATLDRKTSDICQSLDGKVFPMSEYAVGVTAPPFHVWCRTTTVPFFDDEFELDTKRAARDENGKTYFVPSDMKYKDWEKAFVNGGSKKDLKPIDENPLENFGKSSTIGARANTGKKVYYNKDNDYSINIEGISKEVNDSLSEAAKNVAMLGTKDGNEHMYLIDLDGVLDPYYETSGIENAVGFKFWQYAKEHPDSRFAFVHNHNTDSSLSQADLETPIICENIPIQIAIRNDGVKYIAQRKKLAPEHYYPDTYFKEELKELNEKSRVGDITPIERMRKREEIIIESLIREFYEGVEVIDGRR